MRTPSRQRCAKNAASPQAARRRRERPARPRPPVRPEPQKHPGLPKPLEPPKHPAHPRPQARKQGKRAAARAERALHGTAFQSHRPQSKRAMHLALPLPPAGARLLLTGAYERLRQACGRRKGRSRARHLPPAHRNASRTAESSRRACNTPRRHAHGKNRSESA